jgi:hypothetical protein
LQAAAEETGSASLRHEAGFVLASVHPDDQNGGASVVMNKELKDMIAKQVKIIIAGEKAAAAAQGNLPPDEDAEQVPPSLDPRFKLFIASSSLSLDTDDGECALTAGDIVRRTEDTPDADGTVAVEVVSSKRDDCAVGTASRMALDDLEEMHDSFRQKVDDGLKSLSENQGKGGIPNGPAATVHPLPEGETTLDPTVESDLEKQQQAADATEKDVQDISPDGGSADSASNRWLRSPRESVQQESSKTLEPNRLVLQSLLVLPSLRSTSQAFLPDMSGHKLSPRL